MKPAVTADPEATGSEALMFALLAAAHALEDRIESALAPSGLSMSKLGVLTHLVEAGRPLALSELAARLSCVRSNITQLVDRLEADGLVRRVDDPIDRRSVLAAVTTDGEERQRAGSLELAGARESFLASLSADEGAALARWLGALANRADTP